MKKMLFLFLILASQGLTGFAGGQVLPEQLRKAETLRLNYQFKEAAAAFSAIASQSQDSVLRQQAANQLLLCENGQIMLRYIETPVVTGKKTVAAAQFFNYYNIDLHGAWAQLPEELLHAETTGHTSPVFIPETDANTLYFAAPTAGDWDIYVIRRIEGEQWGAPEPLETINTTFDERFPYVTPDGNTLYFSSNGHSGMGGYDLFKSTFNAGAQQWGSPENLGFPYSSPFDDWLFVPNINYTEALFTSSREQKADSLTVYRIALETNPTKQPGRSTLQIQQIAKLQPVKNEQNPAADETAGEHSNDQYQALHKTLQQQQVNEKLVQNDLAHIRKMYSLVDDNRERAAIQTKITEYENELLQMQNSIRQTMEHIQEIEKKLLEQGVTPEFVAAPQPSTTPTTALAMPSPLYFKPAAAFPAIAVLPPPQEEPAEEEKYAFKIGSASHIFYNPPAIDGLIYRIQIGTFSRKLPEKELKGLSPVFIQQDKKLFTHFAGQFSAYKDAEQVLPQVRKQGFRDAMIVGLIDGKKTPMKTAREYEAKHKPKTPSASASASAPPLHTHSETVAVPEKEKEPVPASAAKTIYNVVLGAYPDKLPQTLRQAVQQNTKKDIIKSSSKGQAVYMVGPFSVLAEAKQLQAQLKAKGFDVTIE
jgi:hypothetical protein